MRILLTNDDGINSKGIHFLAKELAILGEVILVAPDKEQSAIGHGITMHHPLRSRRIDFHDTNLEAWWVSGTPADCVKLAMDFILKEKPDFVVSGMNRGENLGKDIFYSGTVSAAIEGAFYGLKSFAVSYEDLTMKNGELAAKKAVEVIKRILGWNRYPEGAVININIPKIEGENSNPCIKLSELGEKKYKNNFEERLDPRGNAYYWLVGEVDYEVEPEVGTDVYAVRNGCISITPIDTNLKNKELIHRLEEYLEP